MVNVLATPFGVRDRQQAPPAAAEVAGGELAREGFGTEPAASRHRIAFLAIAALLCITCAVTFTRADVPLTRLPAFFPAFISSVIVTDLMTAYLLFVHAPLSRRFDLLCLAAAYLFTSTVAIGQLLVFPGALSVNGLFGAGPQSAIWLWVFWHAGFPAFVVAAMTVRLIQRHRQVFKAPGIAHGLTIACAVLCLVAALEALVTHFADLLPPLIHGRSYMLLEQSTPGRIVLALNLGALGMVFWITRGRTVLELGLIIAVLASVLDSVLSMHAGARFSLGWYVARLCAVVSAVSVLVVYLREVTWLYARVIRLNERLAEQATVDVTTGLFNRRHFNHRLGLMLRDAARRQEVMTLLLIDIDHFKQYNDRYGHFAGDECLHRVAQAIAGAIRRPGDVAARYGGEEFAVILPATGMEGGRHIGQRVLSAIHALEIDHSDSKTAPIVTVSIGLGQAEPGSGFEVLIRAADQALYAAKSAGRNQVAPA